MYNSYDLTKLEKVPKFDEFSLSILAEYYISSLCSNKFVYFCSDDFGNKYQLAVSFNIGNFAHLSGIDKCVSNRYGALEIFNNIKSGTWEKNQIKKMDKSKKKSNFKDAKKRMRYMTMVYSIMQNPSVIRFNPNLVVPSTNVKSKYLITEFIENTYVHLGVDIPREIKADYEEILFPRTLLIEGKEKFLEGQAEYKVNKVLIINKSMMDSLDEVAATKDDGVE
ncbi:hypothetical protein SH2C18_48440 [Clostridium sediminicola]|uniref:PBECR4 domain-containing protein n=1 Tax=Clostridium sediminicola TaxID=3114879 RepID=UPI0031F1CAAC